ncbi:kelch-like protein 42 [Protobothrops mucrosquamatus]|uniref:kelch-like protein 42 n=1 Tax=Protobothrops mucrosquamatus TaxID=103944 RepID=UPI00077597A2|nr:kelch-like protein 42 [Protobothrops mucrosquamatus]
MAGQGGAAEDREPLVEVRLGERRFPPVRQRRLVEQSDYFQALYRSGMREAAAEAEEAAEAAGGARLAVQRLRGGLSAAGLARVLRFVETARLEEEAGEEALAELVEAASFLQVRPLLHLLSSRLRLPNCLHLHHLAQVYGLAELAHACLDFMAGRLHQLLAQPEDCPLHLLPTGLAQQLRQHRHRGRPALLLLGAFLDRPPLLRYQEDERRWEPLPPAELPAQLLQVRGFGSATLDDYLFVAGGYRPGSQEIAAAHRYNPWLKEWRPLASLNQKRANFKLLAVSGKLYAVGGQSLSSVECYNPEQDWWTFVAPLPAPLVEFSACECKEKIYVMGGYTPRDRNLNIWEYCPVSDKWTNFETCGTHLRKQQMLSVEETIYIVGGCSHDLDSKTRSGQNEAMLTVQSYNVVTKEWLYLKENTSKSGLNLTCTLHNDGIYILSRDITLSTSLEHRVLLKYNIFSDRWESLRNFPIPGQNMLICSLYFPDLS